MQLTVSGLLNPFQPIMQGVLFPNLQEPLGPWTEQRRKWVSVLGQIQIETLLGGWSGGVGRPSRDRRAIARAFVTKAVSNLNSRCQDE